MEQLLIMSSMLKKKIYICLHFKAQLNLGKRDCSFNEFKQKDGMNNIKKCMKIKIFVVLKCLQNKT